MRRDIALIAGVQFLEGTNIFLFSSVQTGSDSASYPMGSMDFFGGAV
jgi:hypothetical protein